MLNYLINAYIGCVDMRDLIQLELKSRRREAWRGLDGSESQEYLEALKKIQADGKEIEIYKENLDDAIEGTQDAMNVRGESQRRAVAPPPVRRKS